MTKSILKFFFSLFAACVIALSFSYAISPIFRSQIQSDLNIKPQFHLRVSCPYPDARAIEFTNDNWITSQNINKAFDISLYEGEENVVMQLWLGEEKEAVKLAKCFKSYNDCIDYNKKIKIKYDSLVSFRKKNPLTEQTAILKSPKKEECCKVLNIR